MPDTIALLGLTNAHIERRYRTALAGAMPTEIIKPLREMTAAERSAARIAIVANPFAAELAALPALEWLQSLWAGVERLVAMLPGRELPIVRLVDPEMSRTMAEAVLAWTYYLHREMPSYLSQQRERRWLQRDYRKPSSLTIGVLGLGVLGATAALRLAEAGFRVIGWGRTPKALSSIETHCGDEGLDPLLSRSDIVVCLVPLTAATRGLLDARRIGKMKPGAALINFSRGPVVVSGDLLAALNTGHLSHAVLDVFDEEPLPADSIVWRQTNLTVLPHISAPTDFDSSASIVARNVACYRETGAMPDTVDLHRGY
jgi:glyoxylate/hydroxypyruvate reductase